MTERERERAAVVCVALALGLAVGLTAFVVRWGVEHNDPRGIILPAVVWIGVLLVAALAFVTDWDA